jgi:hypothetical protein
MAGRHGGWIRRILDHHVENPPETPADWLGGGGGGGTLCMWLGLAHFHSGYSFLLISPNLLDIWPVFFLILSRYWTLHFLIVIRTILCWAAKNSLRGTRFVENRLAWAHTNCLPKSKVIRGTFVLKIFKHIQADDLTENLQRYHSQADLSWRTVPLNIYSRSQCR